MTSVGCREEALAFECLGERLIGVVSLPAAPSETALIIVVGGPQVRTGSHRQFSQLCRAVAVAGTAAFRFDVRGMGDSSGPLRTFEHLEDDIRAATDALQNRLPGVRRIVLCGLCDGASAALLYCQARRDSRVGGLVLLNPWVRSEQTLARVHLSHYYWARLRQPAFWRKLLAGGVALRAVRELVNNSRSALRALPKADSGSLSAASSFQQRMMLGAQGFGKPILLVLSELDYTAREFTELLAQHPGWQEILSRTQVRRLDVAGADHTFSSQASRETLEVELVRWLCSGAIESRRRSEGSATCGQPGTSPHNPKDLTGQEQS